MTTQLCEKEVPLPLRLSSLSRGESSSLSRWERGGVRAMSIVSISSIKSIAPAPQNKPPPELPLCLRWLDTEALRPAEDDV